MRDITVSDLWKDINEDSLNISSKEDLENFKSNNVNFRIALWNPETNGLRYLKMLIYNHCSNLSGENFERLKKIKKRTYGMPITVKYNDEDVCLDYLRAVYELGFIESKISLDNLSVMEIGAGYGRTCHAILSNCNVKDNIIIDLEPSLKLARCYLGEVLTSKQFNKIKFISNEEFKNMDNDLQADIAINIDSFGEMTENTVRAYLDYINEQCTYFYTQNAVGKYYDKELDNHVHGENTVKHALTTGLLRDILDIHDSDDIYKHSRNFIKVYNPNKWEILLDSWSGTISHYWQALYKKG